MPDSPSEGTATRAADDCSSGQPDVAVSVDAARRRLLDLVSPISDVEVLDLGGLPGRVLAEDVVSAIDVPGADNSAMDGYALAGTDLGADVRLEVAGTAFAGHPFTPAIGPGQAVRIFTGAPMPPGTDTVVMQEHVEVLEDGRIAFTRDTGAGANVRPAGEDVARGSTVLTRGTLLRAAEIGVLAAVGRPQATVFRRPRVAVLATGDELVPPGQPLGPGQIHDSNSATLRSMLWRLGVEVIDLGHAGDDPAELERVFLDAAARADAIVTSGGVSVGDADHVMPTLRRLGELHLWKIAMRPGRPLAFGRIGTTWFFGLPGNPVSVMATFHQIVQPVLQRLMGLSERPPLTLKARLLEPLRKKPGRTEFSRGILGTDAEGHLTVRGAGRQGSGVLTSMTRADCFIVLPREAASPEAGSTVDVQPFAGFVW